MKLDFSKNLPYYLLLAFLASFVILVFQSEGTAGGADDLNHYRFARYAFAHPAFFFDTWAKTVFTLLCAPVAQLGYNAVRVFNVLLGLGAAWLTFMTARKLDYRQPVLALFLLVFAPMYALMMLSGMNEVMFSFFLILGIYLFFSKRGIWSAVVISLLPFIRTEGFILFPIFILAFWVIRQWKAVPFLFSGFLVTSLAGSFHHGEFFWLISQNPYSGNARDIYGSGELLYYAIRLRAISGWPLTVMMAGGLLFLAIRFFKIGRQEFPAYILESLVAFSPFLVYFAAHSYVWWRGTGNSVGELRVMAAVLPSAVLLGMFAWKHFTDLLRPGKSTLNFIGVLLATWLVFIPFRVHAIPVPLAPQQKLIREAAGWLADMGYTEQKIYYFDPFWWFFLGVDPVDNPKIREGVHDRNDPGRNILPGELVLWDAQYGPNEGGVPLERFSHNPDFSEIRVFSPSKPFKVLGGHDYAIHVFERLDSTKKGKIQAVLEEVQKAEADAFRIRIRAFDDCEPARDPLLFVVMSLQNTEEMKFCRTWNIRPEDLDTWEETVIEYKLPEGGIGIGHCEGLSLEQGRAQDLY